MNSTCIVYGSSTGTCQDLASRIATKLGVDSSNVFDAGSISAEQLNGFQNLILGTSTWGAGEMQDDWYEGVKALKAADLTGKTVALFGCGDSEGYSDTFCGGMAELYQAVKDKAPTSLEPWLPMATPTMIRKLWSMENSWDWHSTTSTKTTKPMHASTLGWPKSNPHYKAKLTYVTG